MELASIPGVGEKTAAALAELEDPERALETGDVLAIASAPGITPGRAARIARGAIRERHDDHGTFLATDRAREIHAELLESLQARAVTDYGAAKLETLYPSASPSRIAAVRERTSRALDLDPDPEILAALEDVRPLEAPRDVTVRDRCLATADAETYASAREAVPELSVELVDDARDLADLARGYSTVIALDEAFAGVDVEGDVRVEPDALEDPVTVVPERPLAFFAENRASLLAAIDVARRADLEGEVDALDGESDVLDGELDALDDALGTLDDPPGHPDGESDPSDGTSDAPDDASAPLATLEAALDRLEPDGSVAGDAELERLQTAVDDLDAAVATAESVANDRLRDAIRERDVTIEGADLHSLVERGAGVDSLLQRELADEYADAVAAAREHLVDALELDAGPAEVAERAFPDEPTFPVEHDEATITRLREDLTAERDRRAARLKRELAGDLAAWRDPAEALVRAALELDVALAIARFAADFECAMPVFLEDALPEQAAEALTTGPDLDEGAVPGSADADVAIEGGRSPLLAEPFEAIEPVAYAVDGVVLLSGVNSGGKTATLDLVAAVTILAHMGLPVPAEAARLRRFEALHYHAKTQGTLDAGAFETTVRQFADVAGGEADALVLVDELESITEPGASARIIAGILEALAERDATGVVVSHLAGEIRERAGIEVTVDGIEAEGLEDGELVVNRSPVKGHLARSTPELIVEKLAGEHDADFYERLLEKFD